MRHLTLAALLLAAPAYAETPAWTVLLATIGGPFEATGTMTGHIFPSASDCGDAMDDFEALNEKHSGPPLEMLQCIETGAPSISPFPKPRP